MANNKKKSGRAEYNVPPEKFITTWQTCDSAQEVADKLNMPKPIVLARASSYRADGIKLKKMRRDSKRALDVAALNKLIEELDSGRNPEELDAKDDAPTSRLKKRNVKDTVKELLKEKDKPS